MIPNLILTILQELEIDCLTEKARALSNGKGLAEPWLPDEPEDNFVIVSSHKNSKCPNSMLPLSTQSLNSVLHLPTQSLDEILPLPAPKEKAPKSLAEILASASSQISIDESIQSANNPQQVESVANLKDFAPSLVVPARQEKAQQNQASNQSLQLQNTSTESKTSAPVHLGSTLSSADEKLPKYTLANRLSARHEAKVAWRYDRYKLEYEYARTKQQTNDYCAGLDFVLNALKQMQRKCDALTVTIVEGER